MKKEVTPKNLAEIKERFGTFHDAVIHSFHYDLFSKTQSEELRREAVGRPTK